MNAPCAHNVVGRRLNRLDGTGKVTGAAVYASDFSLPGMLHGRILRSPHPHARILRIETERARALPGVRAIVTARSQEFGRFGNFIKDFEIFASERVRHVGQAVAAVAADTAETAERALAAIEVEYAPEPAVFDPLAALAADAPLVHPEWKALKAAPIISREGNRCGRTVIRYGDVEGAFRQSYRVYEHVFRTRPVHAGYTEPRVAVARWDGPAQATVWCNTQLLFDTQSALAEIFGIPPSQIRVIVPGIGGGFGGKLRLGMEHYALALARAARRPVRVMSTSEEELTAALFRQPAHIALKTGVDREGRLLAKQGRVVVDTGACSGSGPLVASTATMILAGPYRIPNAHIEGIAVYTHNHPNGSMRAPSGPMPNFATESQMDMIAADLGLDPLEIRLRNILREGDVAVNGQTMTGVGLEECLRKAASAIGWSERGPERNRGKGLACSWWMTSRGSSGAYLKLMQDGTLIMMVGVVEIGTGALTGAAQVVAEELGLSLTDVNVVSADSLTTPYDFGSQGSRTLFAVANAARAAAQELLAKMRARAAGAFGVEEAALAMRDKAFWHGNKKLTFAEIAAQAQLGGGGLIAEGTFIAPPAEYDTARVENHFSPGWPSPSFHAHAADVSVDAALGTVTINRYVVAQDVGYAINPTYLEGQLEGGAVQGIGQALFEEIVMADGHVQNGNMTDYKMPTSMDVPPIEVILVTHPSPVGPYGAKGVGEPPCIAPPATIANAVAAASGKRITDLPITAEKIVML
ncbi:MAG: xanthine dehydrogenase family protein molybdopterin-binding subunit [Variibacter sp.]|nr:xanthine dehydrogenase family protein molybdopterin-binding subunit [Variibacter sp.]